MADKKKVVITSGYFNPLHSGHVNLFREAKKLGDKLVVIINSDNQAKLKGSAPFMPEMERVEIIKAIKHVDEIFLSIDTTKSIAESMRAIAINHPDSELFFAKGGDRHSGNIPEAETNVCREFNIQIINDVGGGKVQSSSWLIGNINKFFSVKAAKSKFENISSIEVLGNKIDMVQIPEVIEIMDFWIENEASKPHWIVATGMHGVMESQKNEAFKKMLSSADLWAPDGISLVWLAKLNGFNLRRRVAGPDLFHHFLRHSNQKGYKNYFYGDTQETLNVLEKKLSKDLPNVKTASFSPPFRKSTKEEEQEVIKRINDAKPDVLWVGLGLPKQETWIFEHKDKLNVPVIIGVGVAFKFEAGIVRRAPAWVGNAGFEWLWRLTQEPKRVWKRVFIDAPQFVWLASKEFLRNKKNGKKALS